MTFTPEKRLFAGFALAAFLLAVLLGLVYRSVQQSEAADQRVTHTLTVRAEIGRTLRTLVNVENAARGYAISGLETSLVPYNQERAEAGARLVALVRIVADDVGLRDRVAALQSLSDDTLKLSDALVNAVREQGTAAAPDLVVNAQYKGSMEKLRVGFEQLRNDAVQSVDSQRLAGIAHERALRGWLTGLSLLIGLVLLVTWLTTRSQMVGNQRAQAQLRDVFDNVNDLMHSAGPDGRIQFTNRAWRETLGYSEAEAQTLTLADVLHVDTRAACMEALQRLMQGKDVGLVETAFCTKDGRRIELEGNLSVQHAGDTVIATRGVFRDVTERKIAQQDFERFFKLAAEPLAIGAFSGHFTRVNPAFTELLGWSVEEFITAPFIKFVYPADRAATIAMMQRLGKGQKIAHFVNRMRLKGGGTRWLSWNVTPVPELSISYLAARDVTAERYAQQMLRGTTEDLPGAVYQLYWPRAGLPRLNFISRGIETLSGLAPVDIAGDATKLFNLVIEADRPAFNESMLLAARERKDWHSEFRVRGADGRERWLRGHAAPKRAGGTYVWNGHLFDISEQKAIELSLTLAKGAAEAANVAKSNFLATMSHEIRTPMNAIVGVVELVQSKVDKGDDQEMLGVVRTSAEALLTIIDDILDYSKIEAGRMEIIKATASVADVVESVTALFALRAREKGLDIDTDLDADASTLVEIDAMRVRQILLNLASNAVKFTSRGSVTLRARIKAAGPETVDARIEVIDSGPGVSTEDHARLFLPFAQASSTSAQRGTGTGLGLAISRRLAELMGGKLEMKSALGQGTTMSLTLSLRRMSTAAQAAQMAASQGRVLTPLRLALGVLPSGKTLGHLLVVDDNPVNRMVLTRQAERLGYSCNSAADGKEALAMLSSRQYDAILCDCQMPVMDGYAFAREWRRLESTSSMPRTPIIACTANAMKEEIDRCFQCGMDDYLLKPVTLERMREKIVAWYKVVDDAPTDNTPVASGNVVPLRAGAAT